VAIKLSRKIHKRATDAENYAAAMLARYKRMIEVKFRELVLS
jgi:hypothetical protein